MPFGRLPAATSASRVRISACVSAFQLARSARKRSLASQPCVWKVNSPLDIRHCLVEQCFLLQRGNGRLLSIDLMLQEGHPRGVDGEQ